MAVALAVAAPVGAHAKTQKDDCSLSRKEAKTAIKRSERLMQEFLNDIDEKMDAEGAYGFSLAVAVCGRPVWTETFGHADLENDKPVTERTKFRVGSVSKTMTSAALGKLVEQGRLDLDAKVQDYVPSFPKKAHPITVRQVAGHLAGIRHYDNDEEYYSAGRYDTVLASLDIFADDPLVNEPGSEYSYSSYGWNLLSAVVEAASGEDFLDYMQKHIFTPAGMKNTVADKNAEIIPDRTRFYHFDEESGGNFNAPYVDLSNKWAGGGFLSTPTDLLKFAGAMRDGTLVSPETFSVLTTSQTTDGGEATGYGIGWFTNFGPRELRRARSAFPEAVFDRVEEIVSDEVIIGHSGGSVGGLTLFLMAPGSDGVVTVAATSNNSELYPLFALPVAAEFIELAKP
ncbi:MAG: serine hydrolase domain-containing protein [Pseudomonadota bacterium]